MNPKKAGELLLSSAIAFIIIGLIYAPLSFGDISIIGTGSWKFGIFILLAVILWSYIPVFFGSKKIALKLNPYPFLFSFWLVAFSDYSDRSFVYFAEPFSIKIFLILFFTIGFVIFSLKNRAQISPKAFATLCVVVVAVLFFREVSGKLIFSDDHPSFFYRLQLLRQQFPKIPFYNPQWNGGYSARDFFATGCLNIFFLTLPFLKLGLLNTPANYSLMIGIIPFVEIPLCVYLAMRSLKLGASACAIAVILSLCPSLDFFEWFLRYGTLGFISSIGFIPLVFSLSYRLLLGEEQLGKKGLILLLISSSLCFFWTLSAAAFIPLIAASVIYSIKNFSKTRIKTALIFVTLFLCLNGCWLKTFVTESKVAGFVSNSRLPGAAVNSVKSENDYSGIFFLKAKKKIVELVTKINPLLILLGFSGIFLIKERRLKITLIATLLWLFLAAAFGDLLKPQLELRRMSLIASMMLLMPAALSLENLLRLSSPSLVAQRRMQQLFFSCVLLLSVSAILISPLNAAAIYSNRSDIKFQYASKDVFRLAETLKNNSGGGRVLFLGFILHELGESPGGHQDGGHVAPLALWTNRELYASHFFHARWSAIDPIPPAFRGRGVQGTEEFLDLMDVSEVIAFKKDWLKYCLSQPTYKKVDSIGRFNIFTRTAYKPTKLIEGQAEILSATPGGLLVLPKTKKVILKYRFLPALRSSVPEVKVSGKFIFEEQTGEHQSEPFEAIELEVSQEFLDSGRSVELHYK